MKSLLAFLCIIIGPLVVTSQERSSRISFVWAQITATPNKIEIEIETDPVREKLTVGFDYIDAVGNVRHAEQTETALEWEGRHHRLIFAVSPNYEPIQFNFAGVSIEPDLTVCLRVPYEATIRAVIPKHGPIIQEPACWKFTR